jgi:hypothetical protein
LAVRTLNGLWPNSSADVSESTQQITAERTVESAEAAAPFNKLRSRAQLRIVANSQPNDDTYRVTPIWLRTTMPRVRPTLRDCSFHRNWLARQFAVVA